jgi:hypothetical protein
LSSTSSNTDGVVVADAIAWVAPRLVQLQKLDVNSLTLAPVFSHVVFRDAAIESIINAVAPHPPARNRSFSEI